MTLTMDDLLSPGFIITYVLGFIFLILIARFLCNSFSEYWTESAKPMLLILVVIILGIVFCYYNQELSGHFDIKEIIKGNR